MVKIGHVVNGGQIEEERNLDREDQEIGLCAADLVRNPGPEDAPATVEDADDAHDGRRRTSR